MRNYVLYCSIFIVLISVVIAIPISQNNISVHFALIPSPSFDTGKGEFPSIAGTHNGTITPFHRICVNSLYTYPCAGTGGHTEYIRIENSTWNVTATWNGYKGDWHNITFDSSVILMTGKTYNYTIRTGSYPQSHHADALKTADGWINCTRFRDVNGKVYNNWIPSIKLCK